MEKIIALDIDQFRIGVCGLNYENVFSSIYSKVKKNTWKLSLFKDTFQKNDGSEIQLQDISNTILWGLNKRHSRRLNAYETFGDVLEQLSSEGTVHLVKCTLAYLANSKYELFEEISPNKLKCSVYIGVSSKNFDELKKIEHNFKGIFSARVDGIEFSITIEKVVLVPKSFCSILEDTIDTRLNFREGEVDLFNGLNYVIDVNDHYINCDVYDNGELIKSENISTGIYELSDRLVQEYKTSCIQYNKRVFQIDKDMVYNVITSNEKLLTVNGNQKVDLTELVNGEVAEETKKVLSYLSKDKDIQYADKIIIRDLKLGIINRSSINRYLEVFGLSCIDFDNKSAKGIYKFGMLFSGDSFLESETKNKELQSKEKNKFSNSEIHEENEKGLENFTKPSLSEMEEAKEENDQLGKFLESSNYFSVKKTEENEIDNILKEQNELLNSLVEVGEN